MMAGLAWSLYSHYLSLTRLWGLNLYIQVPPAVSTCSSDILDLLQFWHFI